jgi:hypothetical protein
MIRKYGQGPFAEGITDTVQGTTCFTAVTPGLNGCVWPTQYTEL